MDFDIAAKRLQQDQKSAYNRSRASKSARSASAKSKKEAQAARLKAEKRLQQKKIESERNAQIVDKIVTSIGCVERQLGVANVGSTLVTTDKQQQSQPQTTSISSSSSSIFANINPLSNGWSFKATSIHGDGDKIALPPSILETMISSSNDLDPFGSSSSNGGRPIAFRIGILNLNYTFPSSSKMKNLIENIKESIVQEEKKKNGVLLSKQSTSSITDNDTTNHAEMDDSDDEIDDDDDSQIVEAYLDELSMKYLSYTHGTVVEFTQEDSCVGLPESIARALLQPNSHSLVESTLNDDKEEKIDIPVRRTVDPAASTETKPTEMIDEDNDDDMDVDSNQHTTTEEDDDDDDGEKTPGHLAYGLFDIPASLIEVTPITRLPAGTNCTFTPTSTSIANGFYGLKDIKVVLEQSLMRTRATLSRGDVIHTWRRGTSFDLIVSSLSPSQFGAVSCINTNLNVDFASCENDDTKDEPLAEDNVKSEPADSRILGSGGGGGRLLSEPTQSKESKTKTTSSKRVILPPEPDDDIKEGVCTIQIRGRISGNTVTGRRRFSTQEATLSHLFSFASHVCDGVDPTVFRLVTRFPRRELQLNTMNENKTLESQDIRQGQESFIVEFYSNTSSFHSLLIS